LVYEQIPRTKGAINLTEILLEKTGQIGKIILDHPPANAWNLAAMKSFKNALDQVENDPEVRAVIITGAGEKFFSAGFDVSDPADPAETSHMGRTLWKRVDRFSKPTIAVINGYALGGGLELAMACHFRLMIDSPNVSLGLTELNRGIIPGWGGTQRLPRLVGRAKALDMILFSRRIGSQEALASGLVNEVKPAGELMNSAIELAEALARRPPIAVRCVLEAMAAGLYEGLEAGLRVEEQGAITVRGTRDRAEGFAAFREKREPVFTGE
jgi:enoyl-CoA hydratase/carnithine racemase